MLSLIFASLTASTFAAHVDTARYVVLNHGRQAGEMTVISAGDSVLVRYFHVDRNRGPRSETHYRLAADGTIAFAEARPLTLDGAPNGPTERVEVSSDSVRWVARQAGAARTAAGTWYLVRTSTPYDLALLARYLLRRPDHNAKLLPNGKAHESVVADAIVPTAHGRQHVRFVVIEGVGFGGASRGAAAGIWLDDRDVLVASEVGWFITVRPGFESALPVLRAKEIAHRDREAEALARKLSTTAPSSIVIRGGDLFDSESGVLRPRTTIVIRGNRIVAVGPADSVSVPSDAQVIDATGKTVMPGMWEMHSHDQLTSQNAGAPMQLAVGVTTIRDMASDLDVAVSHRDRAAAGRLVSPRMILAGFLEGPGAWAGPTDVLVRTEADARAWVARYDSLGYKQIKVYNLVHPDLIPTIAAEAHRRGMRLSGHIPRGLSVPAAVLLGFDEIQHAAFLFSTFYQDSLYVPKMRAYSAVASAVAPNINVDGQAMTDLIALLRAHHTVIDGTFSVWVQSAGTGIAGQVGAGVPANLAKADSNYVRLIKRLYDGGVTLIPGTDTFNSFSYVTELELYEKAGIPAPAVLQIATIVPARVMKDDAEYGSIATGKIADLLVVNGHPTDHISDLRKLDLVIRAGRVYEPAAIRRALSDTTTTVGSS